MSAYRLGERLFLPVHLGPYPIGPSDPPCRPLWVYVLDPASIGLKTPVARLEVPYEPLRPGPVGRLFAVDHAPLPPYLIEQLDWPQRLVARFEAEPLDLEDPRWAMNGGVLPSTGEPRFAGQMLYAVCQRVYETFAHALGRHPTWGPWAAKRIRRDQSPALRLRPFASSGPNACYDATAGTLEFGVCKALETESQYVLPNGLVLLALSHDVIAHEVTHALLDGMRAHFMDETHVDVPAFHEAFADLVALFHHFRFRELVEQAIDEQGGLDSDMLLGLARQFGEAIHGKEGRSLRRAVEAMQQESAAHETGRTYLRCDDETPCEPHERGAVLVAAVFSAYLQVFEHRAEPLLRLARISGLPARAPCDSPLPHELSQLLADEACALAKDFLNVCIRAIDYCPPIDIRFGEYLRALITADRVLNPEDRFGLRDQLIKAFRRRSIELRHVRDLSEYSLEWNAPEDQGLRIPGLAWSELRFASDAITPAGIAEVERQAAALGGCILASPMVMREFGLRQPGGALGPITIETIRPLARRGRNGHRVHGLVAEVSQLRHTEQEPFAGGATVLLDEAGYVQFAIRKRVDDTNREAEQAAYRARTAAHERPDGRRLGCVRGRGPPR